MDFITKIHYEHQDLSTMLQQIIQKVHAGHTIHPLWEDWQEKIEECFQAEKACIQELCLQTRHEIKKVRFLSDIEAFKTIFSKINDYSLKTIKQIEMLLSQLTVLQKKLLIHESECKNTLVQLTSKILDNTQFSELCVKFDDEKDKILLKSITYA